MDDVELVRLVAGHRVGDSLLRRVAPRAPRQCPVGPRRQDRVRANCIKLSGPFLGLTNYFKNNFELVANFIFIFKGSPWPSQILHTLRSLDFSVI